MNSRLRKIIGIIFTLFALVILWYVRNIVVYVVVSIVLSIVLTPVMRILDQVKIKKFHLPNWLKALISILLVYGILSVFVNVFTPLLAKEIKILSEIELKDVYESLNPSMTFIEDKIDQFNLRPDDSGSSREYMKQKILSFLDVGHIPTFFTSVMSGVGSFVLAFFSISFITFFLLKDRWILHLLIEAIVPDQYLEKAKKVTERAQKTLTRYFIGLIIQVSMITTFVSVSLTILGVDNALVIGFFAGMINVIPYIGPLIGAVFGMIIAITTNLDMEFSTELLPFVLKVGSVFLIVQLTDNIVFQPLIFSNSIKAHPLEIFLVILVAGQLAGIIGMVIAVPAYSFIRIVAREFFSEFKFIKRITSEVGDED
ncbi:AI-2E family transporter [Salibacter sp.]|jgi:predicted PurR-regulated permease PerM|uniref:AI-2E family transporter n=1 Tax=Salibacter sp. TaxID=2010995 RepID=UPI00286FDED8|nr:AI-2E family transporter [Salibacter sp.]MDR9398773.1 AI-2E family transporter [Salibacter sp.]MDR9488269.1 AI-2E family transporter [Salibacter sp.]